MVIMGLYWLILGLYWVIFYKLKSLEVPRFPQTCDNGILHLEGAYEISRRVTLQSDCILRGSPGSSMLC